MELSVGCWELSKMKEESGVSSKRSETNQTVKPVRGMYLVWAGEKTKQKNALNSTPSGTSQPNCEASERGYWLFFLFFFFWGGEEMGGEGEGRR